MRSRRESRETYWRTGDRREGTEMKDMELSRPEPATISFLIPV